MKKRNISNNKSICFIFLFIFAIMISGITLSYAYYTITMKGSTDTGTNKAANLNITTSLTNADAINTSNLVLIDGSDLTKAEKVSFTVTNNTDSTVAAKYTINLVDMTLTQNLFSKYFKWAIVRNGDTTNMITGDFHDESGSVTEGTTSVENKSVSAKVLISDDSALSLAIGKTDTIDFYIWLQDDDDINQLYLTSGKFSGKLSLNAVPVK